MTYQRRSTLHRQKKKTLCEVAGHAWKETMIPTVRTCTYERCRAVSHLVGGVWTTFEQTSTSTQNVQPASLPCQPVEQLGVSWSSGTLRPKSAPPDVADLRAGFVLPSKEDERRLEREYYNLSRYR